MPGEVRVYRLARAAPGFDPTRQVLARELGVPASDLVINRTCALCGGPHGKPALDASVHGAGAPQFSVSRSGPIHLVAVAGSAVGVDVEVRREVDALAIARRLFSPGEAAFLAGLPEPQAMEAFFDMWTRKEAVGKALGFGLSEEVLAASVLRPGDRVDLPGYGCWLLHDLDVGPGATASLATQPDVTGVRMVDA
jgi:4'-phosphopantetheinyl transferase